MATTSELQHQATNIGQAVRALHAGLRTTQFLAPARMRDYQRSLLEPLVRHARAHVPFYRDSGRLAPLFRADDSIDWDRWRDIPPLTRPDLQQNFDQLSAEVLPMNHGRVFTLSTSGSTGEPARVQQTELALRWSWAALRLRDFDWHKVDPTRRLVHLYPFSPDELGNAGMRRHVAWRSEFKALNLLGERIDIADTRPADDLVDVVASVRPTYLQVQPTALQVMVGADRNRRLPDLKLSAVFCVGEYFPADSRSRIEQYLGCNIFDLYGSVECNYLAARCPRCGNFHVHAEVALIEAVDESGNEVAPGETGKLLVTHLYNYSMPLIRYDHMDFASKAANRCEIALPAFDTIFGKERDPFMFPNGHIIRPGILADDVIDLLGARMIQIAQTAPDRCEIRIVPGSLDRPQMRFDEMTDLLRKTWWDGLQVDYRIVDGFARPTPRAKFQMIKQEYYKRSDIPGG